MKTISRPTPYPSADQIAVEVAEFAKYLATRDVHDDYERAYGEQYYRINTLATILAADVEYYTDPDHGTPAKRLARIDAAGKAFTEARAEIREMFAAWLKNR